MTATHTGRTAEDKRRIRRRGNELRTELAERGLSEAFDHLSDGALGNILDHTGDLDLAVSAVTMRPRPAWVAAEIGL